MHGREVCIAGGEHVWQRGACVVGGHTWQGGHACVAGEMATAADGTHLTGMQPCFFCDVRSSSILVPFLHHRIRKSHNPDKSAAKMHCNSFIYFNLGTAGFGR